MQQDDPWAVDPRGRPLRTEPAQVKPKPEPQVPTSLDEALLALDHESGPVFAVLDGAQFDNLPQELLMGDFVSRPLYLDRGDNNPEQIVTAPHMVWLEERPEKITGRAPKDTIPALMTLIANRPAAVFWQCPDGADALYRHLRGINMVLYPKAALTDYADPEPLEVDEIQQPETSDTHTLVLFRHADANVLAQVVPALNPTQLARLIGPGRRILGAPENGWADGMLALNRDEVWPAPYSGPIRLDCETMKRIESVRFRWLSIRTTAYLRRYANDATAIVPN